MAIGAHDEQADALGLDMGSDHLVRIAGEKQPFHLETAFAQTTHGRIEPGAVLGRVGADRKNRRC